MRAVIQRVSSASVSVLTSGSELVVGSISSGILIYLGVGQGDTERSAEYLAEKAVNLRIFMDTEEKMNLSVLDLKQEVLVISQFTLYADARKGRRPSYSDAAGNDVALPLYNSFCEYIRKVGLKVETGVFGAIMRVHYINEGPITILLDSKKQF